MRPWVLPGAAVAFGLGVLAGRAHGPTATGPVLLAAGAALLVVSAAWGTRRRKRSRAVLEAAGLDDGPPERPGPRERILGAAGFPGSGLSRRAALPRSGPGRAAGALAGVALLGAGWTLARAALVPRGASWEGRYVGLRGIAASDVRRFPTSWGLEVSLESVAVDRGWAPFGGRVWVSGYGRPPAVQAGQPVSGSGLLRTLPRDPTGFERYLADRGIVASVSGGDLGTRGPPANPAMRLANTAREALQEGAFRVLPTRKAALLLGLTIGDTSRMDPEVEEDFRASGLGHLLAVSGSNVAMVLVPIMALAGLFRLGPTGRCAVGLTSVALFALVTRWEPSVLRASGMVALALVAMWSGRPRSTAASLGAAVLALLVADPNLAGSVGFQLSVAATVGLVALAGPIATRLASLPRPVAVAAAATTAAQAGVTPLLLLHFGTVPTVTLLANVVAFPAVAVAILAGTLTAGAALVLEPVGQMVSPVAEISLGYLIGTADVMARFPIPSLIAGGPVIPAVVGAVTAVAAWRLRRGRKPVGTAMAILALAALAWSSLPAAGPPASVTVTFLDVGQGDAAVVRGPDGATILVDAGPDEHQVAVDLAGLGVRRIDLAVASHAHADHIEGFPAVLSRFPVSLMIEPGCPADTPSYLAFVRSIRDEDVPVRHPRGGQRLRIGSFLVEVLGPDGCSPGGSEPNDDSLVLRVTAGTTSILFPGDAEVEAQADLLEDGDPIQATVLKVPHHGGDTSDPAFVDATEARLAVVSTGPNDYGHPVPSVLAALRAQGMRVYRTDLAGDVTVRFGPEGLLVESAG
jgi:competence protein ComEC